LAHPPVNYALETVRANGCFLGFFVIVRSSYVTDGRRASRV